ncbi:lipopolysaccharide-induced tumor necrosis factor-alpha factor homolog [Drosophila takahashii]|uniref:lipopolysaccharide-induced tumor necrosis factor-alpha factor homolog n=1 Tax=Drosophila takahashii TaxID=29030 RepID=UPI001CF92A36|nr:lipopolysaccharide-induced tumor necrosis factor-alpha factor homolog [Drosophila takahashii]
MAEEKHRMLYQGQDPSQQDQLNHQDQPKQRPLSLSPSEPPTYDDAMNRLEEEEEVYSQVEEGSSEELTAPPERNFFIVAPQPKLGSQAMDIVCLACGQRGFTRLKSSPNKRTNIFALWLCILGWCCCACLCPYFWNCCRTTNHYCSACDIFLGAHYPTECC